MKRLLTADGGGVGDDKNISRRSPLSRKKKTTRVRAVKKPAATTKRKVVKVTKVAKKPLKKTKTAATSATKLTSPAKRMAATKIKAKAVEAKAPAVRRKRAAKIPVSVPEVVPPPVLAAPAVVIPPEPVPEVMPAPNGHANGHHKNNGLQDVFAKLVANGKEALGKMIQKIHPRKGVDANGAKPAVSAPSFVLPNMGVSGNRQVALVEEVVTSAGCASIEARSLLHQLLPLMIGESFQVNYAIRTMAELGFTKEPLYVEVMNQEFLTKWSREHYTDGKQLSRCPFNAGLVLVNTPDLFPTQEFPPLIVATPLMNANKSYPKCLFVVHPLRNSKRQAFLSTVWINDGRRIPLNAPIVFTETAIVPA